MKMTASVVLASLEAGNVHTTVRLGFSLAAALLAPILANPLMAENK